MGKKRMIGLLLFIIILTSCTPTVKIAEEELPNNKTARYSTLDYIESVTLSTENEIQADLTENNSSTAKKDMAEYLEENADTSGFDRETRELFNSITEKTAEVYGDCGEKLKWYYKDGVLVIKGKGEMDNFVTREHDFYYELPPWREYYKYAIKTVIVGNGCTSIGNSAFADCESLTNITLPKSVAQIGNAAFYDCGGLEEIVIPEGISEISQSAFGNCTRLRTIILPTSVKVISDLAFSGCTSLESITLPDEIVSIGGAAFSDCSSLMSVRIPKGVTDIEWCTFSGCTSLTKITLPNDLTNIDKSAFYDCDSLTDFVYY